MTTATTNPTLEAAVSEVLEEAKVEILEAVELNTPWKGNVVNHALNARAQSIAAKIEPLGKETEKGITWSKQAYYGAAGQHGFVEEAIKDLESFNADYASAVHAVSTDKSLSRFKAQPEAEEYSVKAHIAETSVYKDNVKRHYSRTVRNPKTGETSVQETYGYHNPSISTEYKGFNDSRQAVHALAKDLLG